MSSVLGKYWAIINVKTIQIWINRAILGIKNREIMDKWGVELTTCSRLDSMADFKRYEMLRLEQLIDEKMFEGSFAFQIGL